MRIYIYIITLLSICVVTKSSSQTLLWSEEFNSGTVPNSNVWSYDLGSSGWGNSELQNYTSSPDNVRVENGYLVITANKQGNNITSARLKTLDKLTVRYGTVEARISTPDLANGLWPAFWLLGNNFPTIGWPRCGEIDIMEMGSGSAIAQNIINRDVSSAAHWGPDGNRVYYSDHLTLAQDIDGQFVTYRMEWTPSSITTYINNQQIWVIDITPTNLAAFHEPFFFLLNLAVGGNFMGIYNPNQITAPFPAEYKIDYIRVYDNGYTSLGGSSLGNNNAPEFNSDPLTLPSIQAGSSYSEDLSSLASDDDGDVLTFSKISGPSWLSVSPTGQLTGNPQNVNVGINTFVLSVVDSNGGSDVSTCYISVEGNAVNSPYLGSSFSIPGEIEAEDFDNGGNGVSYFDTTEDNLGLIYTPPTIRTDESVDIQSCSEGGWNVGWIEPTEYLEYTIDVPFTGSYIITSRVARSSTSAGSFHFEINDVDISGSITVNDTGGWQSWEDVICTVNLEQGEHILRFFAETDGVNVNKFTISVNNSSPVFNFANIYKANAETGLSYNQDISNTATDYNTSDILTFEKLTGPIWLNVSSNGILSGIPQFEDAGNNNWTVKVSDQFGASDTATLHITVINNNAVPQIDMTNYIVPEILPNKIYSSDISSYASDQDGDIITFNKISGPAWLNVSTNGVVSGTPSISDIGINSFFISVSDANTESNNEGFNINVTPLPQINITYNQTDLTLSWSHPINSFSIFGTTNLLDSNSWYKLSDANEISEDNYQNIIPINYNHFFFRLDAEE